MHNLCEQTENGAEKRLLGLDVLQNQGEIFCEVARPESICICRKLLANENLSDFGCTKAFWLHDPRFLHTVSGSDYGSKKFYVHPHRGDGNPIPTKAN